MPREKDLKRHFRAEGEEAAPAPQAAQPMTPAVKDWAPTVAITDNQLKTALNYVHGLAEQSGPGRTAAQAK